MPIQFNNKTMTFAMGGEDQKDFAKRWEDTFGRKTCWSANYPDLKHLHPCGEVPGQPDLCACGCDAYGMRCTDSQG